MKSSHQRLDCLLSFTRVKQHSYEIKENPRFLLSKGLRLIWSKYFKRELFFFLKLPQSLLARWNLNIVVSNLSPKCSQSNRLMKCLCYSVSTIVQHIALFFRKFCCRGINWTSHIRPISRIRIGNEEHKRRSLPPSTTVPLRWVKWQSFILARTPS